MRQYIRGRPFSRVASLPTDGGRYHPLFSYSPFLLLLPLLRFPCHLLLVLLLFLPISPASFLTPVPGTHSITTTPLTRPPYSPRVRSRKYKRHWRLMEMDEMRGKRTIEKWWKIEWGRTREKIRRTKGLTRIRRCWGERGIGSSPDPYTTTVFIF